MNMIKLDNRKLYTIIEVAEFFRVSEITVRRLIYRKEIECIKVGNQYRFTAQSIEEYYNTHVIRRRIGKNRKEIATK